jgi:hypothetical protein
VSQVLGASVLALGLLAVPSVLPASAQTGSGGTSGSSGTSGATTDTAPSTTTSADYGRRPTDWGWLGLIGLAGLAGLRRKSEPVRDPYRDPDVGVRR